MRFKYFSLFYSFYHQNRSFKIQKIESACSYIGTKLYCRVSIYPFKCTITYNVKNRNSAEDRKYEVCPVDSTRCERNFCFPSNKDKSGTRTNDIHDRNFQSKRSARHVRTFFHVTPSRKCTMHEASREIVPNFVFAFHHVHSSSSVFPMMIIFRSSFNLHSLFSVSPSKYRSCV